jgi:hypothetical protein
LAKGAIIQQWKLSSYECSRSLSALCLRGTTSLVLFGDGRALEFNRASIRLASSRKVQSKAIMHAGSKLADEVWLRIKLLLF